MPRTFTDLERLISDRGAGLLATATLLTGSRPAGEDLLQSALERTTRAWSRIDGDAEGYLRRAMYHLAVDQWRIRRRRRETALVVEPPPAPDSTDGVPLRHALIQALRQLPARQRAVLVLRYWEQLTEAEAATALGCSIGTVKSSASRGLARLRDLTAGWLTDEIDGAPTSPTTGVADALNGATR
jgi:RNA polymerase sigma-70 factor (sigma-E family)